MTLSEEIGSPDITGVERVDGLQGALIVRPQGPEPLKYLYDEERIITMSDWYHDQYGSLTFATSRSL